MKLDSYPIINRTPRWVLGIVLLIGVSLAYAGGQENSNVGRQGHTSNIGASTSRTAQTTSESSFEQRDPRYKLGPGDSFDVFFDLSPEFNQTAIVQPDGYVTLRGIGDVHVADRTMPELAQLLRSAYGKILHEPLINLVLKDFERPYFIADGQVGRPGKYDLRGNTTLTQAIAMSGGFLENAKHSQVLLFRRASDGWFSAQIFDVKKMQSEGDLHEDPQLHPGDMLFVPKNRFSKIKPFIPGASVGTFIKPY